ncbi:hypothetical protein ACJJTC_004774, partial [Scirpophaga incertulas]
VVAEFEDVEPDALYDVLHDPEYRSVWDTHMLAAEDAGHINVNNDVGYYAMSCPAPLKNRDFVLQRSWLDTGDEKMILNHSVFHKDYPPRKGFVRDAARRAGGTATCLIRKSSPKDGIMNRLIKIFDGDSDGVALLDLHWRLRNWNIWFYQFLDIPKG